MPHLITSAMLDAAAEALVGHGTMPVGDRCLCGYDATPVRRHLAEVMATAIGPALSIELMTVLARLLPEAGSQARIYGGMGLRPAP